MPEANTDDIDWSLTTWEGARREQLRRWAELPPERIVLAPEEMLELAEWLSPGVIDRRTPQRPHDEPP